MFRPILILGHIQELLTNTNAHWDIFRHFCGILSHIQTYSELCTTPAYTNHAIFRTLVYLKHEAFSQPSHIHNLTIFQALAYLEPKAHSNPAKLWQTYSEPCHCQTILFRHYSVSHIQACSEHCVMYTYAETCLIQNHGIFRTLP